MENIDLGQLGSLLGPILSDPAAMEELSAAAAQLGLGDLLAGAGGTPQQETSHAHSPTEEHDSDSAPADIGAILGQVLPLIGAGGQDDNTRLLSALRPFLHGSRAKRLEDAERMVKLLGVMSALRGQGIL